MLKWLYNAFMPFSKLCIKEGRKEMDFTFASPYNDAKTTENNKTL
jgi:hypothetical protein